MAKIMVRMKDVIDPRGYIEQEVEATVTGGLAVHELVTPYTSERGRWAITHIVSGRLLAWVHTRDDALELAGRLLPLASWGLDDAEITAAVSKETREEIAALCREYQRLWADLEG